MLRNGAFATYLQQTCIAKQLAMSFLKFPSTMVRTVLQEWAEYLESPECAKDKARASKLDSASAKAFRVKEHQLRVKHKVHSLKHLIRQMEALHVKKLYTQMSWQERQQYKKWWSGHLDQELESLTLEHGYGKLPLDKHVLLLTRYPHDSIMQFLGKRKHSTRHGGSAKWRSRIRLL